ncbi:MAG: iron-sulfur cluster assembly scaffold protein [Candidatus Shapirobacteria bacterium]
MFKQLYSEKVLQHVRHPQNMGEIKNPDGVATVGNKQCGDIMRMFIKVKNKDGVEYLDSVKFQTLGCGAAIATSSIATTMIKGKPLVEAEKLTNQAIVDNLGGLPAAKLHCSVLAAQALQKAIQNYREKNVRA